MKALVYRAPGVVEVGEVARPEPAAGEALVRVHASGICGTDLAIGAGKHPRAKPPLVMGHETAGEVVEVRAGGREAGVRVGDKVTIYPLFSCGSCWACRHGAAHVCRTLRLVGIDRDGTFAEYVAVPTDLLLRLPAKMSYVVGALVEPLAVGMHAAAMGGVEKGELALVIGAGPIGLVTALAAREAGAGRVIVTDVNAFRLGLAKRLGFETMDASSERIAQRVAEETGGEGADIVLEAAGSETSAREMTEAVRSRGRIVMVSVHKDIHGVDLRAINFKELTMVGARVYAREDYQRAIELAEGIGVEELVTHKVGLSDAARGFEIMRKGEGSCKVLIVPEG
ncbi:MAG: alcohol dehydrogenase catalytic domain-containing protein [Planctomycetota bacterium]